MRGASGVLLFLVWASGCGTSEPLRLSLEVPGRVQAGETVPITLRVTNSGEEAVDLRLRGRPPAFDVAVAASDGSVVWRRLEGAIGTAILQTRTLEPGESLELRGEWDQRDRRGTRVAPGPYTVRGTLPTESRGPLEAGPVPLRILPRDG